MFCIHIFTIFILYMQFIPLLCITNIAYFVYPFCLIFSLFDNSILELSLISYIFIYYHDSMPSNFSRLLSGTHSNYRNSIIFLLRHKMSYFHRFLLLYQKRYKHCRLLFPACNIYIFFSTLLIFSALTV